MLIFIKHGTIHCDWIMFEGWIYIKLNLDTAELVFFTEATRTVFAIIGYQGAYIKSIIL